MAIRFSKKTLDSNTVSQFILIDGEGKEIRQEKTKGAKLQKISAEELILQKKLRPGMSLVLRDTVVRRLEALDTSDYRQHDRLVEVIHQVKQMMVLAPCSHADKKRVKAFPRKVFRRLPPPGF